MAPESYSQTAGGEHCWLSRATKSKPVAKPDDRPINKGRLVEIKSYKRQSDQTLPPQAPKHVESWANLSRIVLFRSMRTLRMFPHTHHMECLVAYMLCEG